MESYFASLPLRAPSLVYPALGFLLALGALPLSPSLPPLILLLAVLRLHLFTLIPRSKRSGGLLQFAAISLAITIVHAKSSLHALSTPLVSITVLIIISATTTAFAGVALAIGYYVERAKLIDATVTIFPAVWATAWAVVEYCSPIGQLTTWSPVVQLGGYAWLQGIGGQVAINWVVAAWSVVFADAAGAWMVGSSEESEKDVAPAPTNLIDDGEVPVPSSAPNINGASPTAHSSVDKTRLTLLLVLLALAVPSYFISDMPSHVAAPDVTPFGLACALPQPMRNGQYLGPPGLDDYISESRKLQGQASIVLWPESAVRFESRNEREEAFRKIRDGINRGVYYGVGFDERVSEDSPDGAWKVGQRRNGLVLLGAEGVVYEYYKRHLVPSKHVHHASRSRTHANASPMYFMVCSSRVLLDDALQREALDIRHAAHAPEQLHCPSVGPRTQLHAAGRPHRVHLPRLHHRVVLCGPALAPRARPCARAYVAQGHRARDVGAGAGARRGARQHGALV